MASDSDDSQLDNLLEAEAEAAALRRAIAEGAVPGVTLADLENAPSDDSEEESEDGASDKKKYVTPKIAVPNNKALKAKLNALSRHHASLQWIEKMDIVDGDLGLETTADVHDDLKREVAFYDLAIASVAEARSRFKAAKIPFARPSDFYAEMVKTDDHMAKVKDRLIFESKKIEAFEKRKSNKEYKLRAKEARENKLLSKQKAKKDHLQAVADWANNAASNRITGRVRDDDDEYLSNMQPNKKRMAYNNKYGHGGKRSRYKTMDKSMINDMSQYNPKGNFDGGKKNGKKGGRQGKRARDAARLRRKS